MRIGIFTDDFYPITGGQGTNIIRIYNDLKKKNEVFVFSPSINNLKGNITLFRFTRKFGKNLIFSFLLHFRIKRLIEQYALDKVIIQGGPGGVFMIRKLPIEQEYIANHTYYQQTKYIKSQFWKKIFIPIERIGYKNSGKIRSISESTRDVLVNNYSVGKKKIFLEHPKPEKRFKELKIKKIPNSLLYVGRLDKRKGIDFLIETIPLVVKEDPNIKLFIIGKGKLREKLERFIKRNNIEKNVKFLGFVSDEDLPKWYNKCKLTIVPSIFEGFGITAIESLACGTPVIATNTDGLKDIIKDKKMLVEYGDKEELKDKIVENLR